MSGHNEPFEQSRADWNIEDPGDEGAIPVQQSGVCNLVTAAAETRTLAIPTFIGQEILLVLDTDGGDAVVTVAAAINKTGETVITFTDAGGMAKLEAATVAGALVWRLVSISTTTDAEGVTLG